MAKFTYNGDHVNFEYYGCKFRVDGVDHPATITDPDRVKRLRTNSHFDEILAKKPGRPKKTT